MNSPADSATPRNDRVLAALAHAGILLWGYGGFIPAIIWSIRRRESSYTAFQTLQALAYQVISIFVYVVVCLVVLIVLVPFSIPLLKVTLAAELTSSADFTLWIVAAVLLLVLAIAFTVLGLAGVVASLLGRDFRYPLIGGWLETQLCRLVSPSDGVAFGDPAERIMAALCHLNVILVISGMLVPLVVGVMEKSRSLRLQKEAAAALLWQGLQSVFWVGMSVVGGVASFLFPLLFYLWLEQPGQGIGGAEPLQVMAVALVILFALLVCLLVLAGFQVYGLLAFARVLKGSAYRYPLIARWLS